MKNRKEDWGWDSGLLRHRVIKSLGLKDTPQTKNKTLTAVLADADEELEHLPFRISDVVLVTEKIPVISELLGQGKKSVFWQTISQSENIFLFCDPYRPVDSSVIIASKKQWWEHIPNFNEERKTLSSTIQTYNRQLNTSAYAWII